MADQSSEEQQDKAFTLAGVEGQVQEDSQKSTTLRLLFIWDKEKWDRQFLEVTIASNLQTKVMWLGSRNKLAVYMAKSIRNLFCFS